MSNTYTNICKFIFYAYNILESYQFYLCWKCKSNSNNQHRNKMLTVLQIHILTGFILRFLMVYDISIVYMIKPLIWPIKMAVIIYLNYNFTPNFEKRSTIVSVLD